MAKTKNPRQPTKEIHRTTKANHHHQLDPKKPDQKSPHSWVVMKSILTCKHLEVQPQQHQQQQDPPHQKQQKPKKLKQKQEDKEGPTMEESLTKKTKKMRCSGSLCNNTKVMQKPGQQQQSLAAGSSPDPLLCRRIKPSSSASSSSSMSISIGSNSINDSSNRSFASASGGGGISSSSTTTSSSYSVSNQLGGGASSSGGGSGNSGGGNSSGGGSFKGMPFRRFSGCYECRMVVDPVLGFTRDPSLRATICTCPDCGEIFMKPEYLELHQATRHAVSELGPEDTSKNIVEIIFQSSWLRKQAPVCKIDRILKVQNTPKTISRFEEYRDMIKARANRLPKKHPRCIADGNELLRFHCTTFMCSLGLNGSSNLCNQIPNCNVCSIIRNGFKLTGSDGPCNGPGAAHSRGILTTATSGRAHDRAEEDSPLDQEHCQNGPRRAMLVCRVIAGRVRKNTEGGNGPVEEYDSVAGAAGVYSNLDELYVFNARAILPCFVVIYRGF